MIESIDPKAIAMAIESMKIDHGVRVVYADMPLDEPVVSEIECEGGILDDLLSEVHTEDWYKPCQPLTVTVNGSVVELEEWPTYQVPKGSVIAATHVPGGPISALILDIVFAVGQLSTATLVTYGVLAASVLTSLLMGVPDQANIDLVNPQQSPSLQGVQNEARLNRPILRNYGTNTIVFPLASLPNTETVGEDQFQRVIFSGGYGPNTIDESSLKFGETLITDTDTEYVLHPGDGTWKHVYADGRPTVSSTTPTEYDPLEAPVLRIAQADIKEDAVNVNFRFEYNPIGIQQEVIQTTTQEADQIGIELLFRSGFGNIWGDGELQPNTIYIGIDVQETVSGSYTPVTDLPDFTSGAHLTTVESSAATLTGTFGIDTTIQWAGLGLGSSAEYGPGSFAYYGGPIPNQVVVAHEDVRTGGGPFNSYITESRDVYRNLATLRNKTWNLAIVRTDAGSFIDDRVVPGSVFELSSFPGLPSNTFVRVGLWPGSVQEKRLEISEVLDENFKKKFQTGTFSGVYNNPGELLILPTIAASAGRTLDSSDVGSIIKISGMSRNEIRQGFLFDAPDGKGLYNVRIRMYEDWARPQHHYTKDRGGTASSSSLIAVYGDFTWTALRAYQKVDPVMLPGQTLIEMRSRATDHLDGIIKSFKGILTSKLGKIVAGPSYSATALDTRNPADIALDILIGTASKDRIAVADIPEEIDLAEWLVWRTFCNDEPLYYDRVHDYDSTQFREVHSIAAVGRAGLDQTEKWRPVIEQEKSPLVYTSAFTPNNAKNLTWEKTIHDPPHAHRVKFRNAAKDHHPDVVTIYAEEYGPILVSGQNVSMKDENLSPFDGIIAGPNAFTDKGIRKGAWVRFAESSGVWSGNNAYLNYSVSGRSFQVKDIVDTATTQVIKIALQVTETVDPEIIHPIGVDVREANTFETIEQYGVTTEQQAWDDTTLRMRIAKLRPEVFKWETSWEQLVVRRGDVVPLSHYVLLNGHGWGRVSSTTIDGGPNLTHITLTNPVRFEETFSYVVQLRRHDGTSETWPIINEATIPAAPTETNVLELDPSILNEDVEDDVLAWIGPSGTQSIDVVITNIESMGNLGARITAAPYAPLVYDLDGVFIPDYDPRVSSTGLALNVPPGVPENVNAHATFRVLPDGTYEREVRVTFRAAAAFQNGTRNSATARIEVQLRRAVDGGTPVGPWRIGKVTEPSDDVVRLSVPGGASLVDVRVRAISQHNVESAWSTVSDVKMFGATGKVKNVFFSDVLQQDPSGDVNALRISWEYPIGVSRNGLTVSSSISLDRFTGAAGDFKGVLPGQQVVFSGFATDTNNAPHTVLSLNDFLINTVEDVLADESSAPNISFQSFYVDDRGIPLLEAESFIVEHSVDGGEITRKTVNASGRFNALEVPNARHGLYQIVITALGPAGRPGDPASFTFKYEPSASVDLPKPRGFRVKGSPRLFPGQFSGPSIILEWKPVSPIERFLDSTGIDTERVTNAVDSGVIDCYTIDVLDPKTSKYLDTKYVVRGNQQPTVTYDYDINATDSRDIDDLARRDVLFELHSCDKFGNVSDPAYLLAENPVPATPTLTTFQNNGTTLSAVVISNEAVATDQDGYICFGRIHDAAGEQDITVDDTTPVLGRNRDANNVLPLDVLQDAVYISRFAEKDLFGSDQDNLNLTDSVTFKKTSTGHQRVVKVLISATVPNHASNGEWFTMMELNTVGTGSLESMSWSYEFGVMAGPDSSTESGVDFTFEQRTLSNGFIGNHDAGGTATFASAIDSSDTEPFHVSSQSDASDFIGTFALGEPVRVELQVRFGNDLASLPTNDFYCVANVNIWNPGDAWGNTGSSNDATMVEL